MAEGFQELIDKCIQMGAGGAKLIDTGEIIFDSRSHLKCRFGCNRWGKFWTCPPHNGISQEMFMESFKKYKVGLIIKTADPQLGQDISIVVEKEALLSHGAVFAFALALCVKCDECAYPVHAVFRVMPDHPWMLTVWISGKPSRSWTLMSNLMKRDKCSLPGIQWFCWTDSYEGVR